MTIFKDNQRFVYFLAIPLVILIKMNGVQECSSWPAATPLLPQCRCSQPCLVTCALQTLSAPSLIAPVFPGLASVDSTTLSLLTGRTALVLMRMVFICFILSLGEQACGK